MAVGNNPFQLQAPVFKGANPWLGDMFGGIANKVSTTMNQQVLPNIGRNSVMTGGYGGSRQGIAEGLALAGGNQQMIDSMAQTGFQAYEGDQNRGVQRAGIEANTNVANMNNALNESRLGLDEYNAQNNWARTAQQDQMAYLDKLLGWNQQFGVGNAGQVQQQPMVNWQQMNQGAQGLGGMGQQQSTPYYGNPLLGAIGGWQLGSSIFGG